MALEIPGDLMDERSVERNVDPLDSSGFVFDPAVSGQRWSKLRAVTAVYIVTYLPSYDGPSCLPVCLAT